MKEEVRTKLRERAAAARRAPDDLLDAMVEAAKNGATNLDIAKEIDFFYNPDYIGKLISKRVGKRRPGRRPRRSIRSEQSEPGKPSASTEGEQPEP